MPPVTLIINGAGSRGTGYAEYARQHPDQVRIVGVAEPRDFYRQQLVDQHHIPPANVFRDWREVAEQPRLADGAIISTPDQEHVGPAVALAKRGYHLLLEKPMAPTLAECRQVIAAVRASGVMLAVCHVMRYTAYTQKVKEIVTAGRLGEVISLQHLEAVGWWHQAHSFVRGNWRNEAGSSFMLLAKSCHDLDWISYIMDRRCTQVSSFGNLKHFRKEAQPPGAADRCLECRVEPTCPYSAPRIYLERVKQGETGWPVDVLTPDVTLAGVTAALRTGPYGRCVYACDNDVVDHQIVNMQFADGATANFTMTAFNRARPRETHIFGTHGEMYGDGHVIRLFDFLTGQTETLDTRIGGAGQGGHGGGDEGLMRQFIAALSGNDPQPILSGPDATLESHTIVFAAEQARREGRVVDLAI
jgi:predicted dehydrogenase